MDILTKEKSSKKENECINNQNNSASYFRLYNTVLHHNNDNKIQLRKDQ